MAVGYLPALRLTLCKHGDCTEVIRPGMKFCPTHMKPEWRQSEPVDPQLAERNRMVMAGECFVYAVDGGASVKIGKALNVGQRFVSLQVGSPVELKLLGSVLGPKTLEQDIHRWGDQHRLKGEWFSKSPEMMRIVDAVTSGSLDSVLNILKETLDYKSKYRSLRT